MNEPTLLNSAPLVCGHWSITTAAYALLYARPHESNFAFAPIECQELLRALKIDAEFRTPSGAILIRSEQPPVATAAVATGGRSSTTQQGIR